MIYDYIVEDALKPPKVNRSNLVENLCTQT